MKRGPSSGKTNANGLNNLFGGKDLFKWLANGHHVRLKHLKRFGRISISHGLCLQPKVFQRSTKVYIQTFRGTGDEHFF